jgi:hypothetical protein
VTSGSEDVFLAFASFYNDTFGRMSLYRASPKKVQKLKFLGRCEGLESETQYDLGMTNQKFKGEFQGRWKGLGLEKPRMTF